MHPLFLFVVNHMGTCCFESFNNEQLKDEAKLPSLTRWFIQAKQSFIELDLEVDRPR